MKYLLAVFLIFTVLPASVPREIACSEKPFVCYDDTRFYQCARDKNGDHSIRGYLQSCPAGLICDDLNEFECEENVSKEFLTEEGYAFQFNRKNAADDF